MKSEYVLPWCQADVFWGIDMPLLVTRCYGDGRLRPSQPAEQVIETLSRHFCIWYQQKK